VELGTIIVTGQNHGKGSTPARNNGNLSRNISGNSPIVFWDVLGASVLQRTIGRLRQSGLGLISVFNAEDFTAKSVAEPWEKAILDYARSGVERILLLTLGAYSEIDFSDLLRFHLQSGSPVTNVSDDRGSLGISIIEAKAAVDHGAILRSRLSALSSCSSTYEFTGYSNRLETVADYRRLGLHGLTGLCELKPLGREAGPGIWVGDGARISKSARVLGPAYIGAGSRLRPGALALGGVSIERNCDIDCGTVIENSSVLPRTYLGPGLHLSQSVVNGSRLLHLGRNLEVDLAETNLLGWTGNRTSRRILETLGALFTFRSEPSPALSTPPRAPASLDYVRSQSFFD
jgi:hypothetical protein